MNNHICIKYLNNGAFSDTKSNQYVCFLHVSFCQQKPNPTVLVYEPKLTNVKLMIGSETNNKIATSKRLGRN